MHLSERNQALSWYRQALPDQLASMALPAQADARGVTVVKLPEAEACRSYRRLLANELVPDATPSLCSRRAAMLWNRKTCRGALFLEQTVAAGDLPGRTPSSRGLAATTGAAGARRRGSPRRQRAAHPTASPGASGVALAATPPQPASAMLQRCPALPPRKSFGEMLAGFMEEEHPLGRAGRRLLIVGCSIALVISLWPTLRNISVSPVRRPGRHDGQPSAPAFYTLSHWKLEATSRVLLIIGPRSCR